MSATVSARVERPASPSRAAALPLAAYLAGSAVLAAAALLTHAAGWYPWALVAATALGAGWPAVVDARTRTLPNRLVGPFAAAAALQLLAAAVARASWQVLAWGAIAAAAAGALYLLMGLAGWVAYGDLKFAPGLALAAAAAAGAASIWLTPVAIAFTGLWLVIARLRGDRRRAQPHGPAMAAAAVALMAAGILWPV